MRLAIFSGAVPSPGKFLGHVVTILSVRLPVAIAGVAKEAAAAPKATEDNRLRRLTGFA